MIFRKIQSWPYAAPTRWHPCSVLFWKLRKLDSTSSKTLFIRSANRPVKSTMDANRKPLQRQPYDKFLVLDFEATCDNGPNALKPQEIIEFPCILIELSTTKNSFEILSYFHSYVKPMIHTELTDYCTQLTGITQDMVNNSSQFDDVLFDFNKWYKKHTNDEKKSIIVTSGNWDLGNIFLEQCKLFPTLQIPEIMYTWINIKKLYALTMGHYPYGIKNMLQTSNLKQIGSIHNGMDDCVNIINIMNYLARRGCLFKATNKFSSV